MFLLLNYNKKRRQHKVNVYITITERNKWIYEALEEPMDAIESDITSLKQTDIH
jgi:flagellar basal body-associated protein FliL